MRSKNNISKLLEDYLNFLKSYNYKIQPIDKITYSKNLKLIANINKITKNKLSDVSIKTEYDKYKINEYELIQSKIKTSLNYTFKRMLETDKYDKAILSDYNSFFTILSAIAYEKIKTNKQYLDLTAYL